MEKCKCGTIIYRLKAVCSYFCLLYKQGKKRNVVGCFCYEYEQQQVPTITRVSEMSETVFNVICHELHRVKLKLRKIELCTMAVVRNENVLLRRYISISCYSSVNDQGEEYVIHLLLLHIKSYQMLLPWLLYLECWPAKGNKNSCRLP